MRQINCKKGSAGFTLIELLTVISVIAVLMSILMPSLRQTKNLARELLCKSRLSQWALGFESYAIDNDFYYPHIDGLDRQGSDVYSENLPDKDKADFFGWVDVIPPYLDEKPWREHKPYKFPDSETIFQCPSARLKDNSSYGYRPERNGWFSYAMNSCLALDENCWHDISDTSGPMPSFLKTTKIIRPSKVVLLFEQLLDPAKGYDGNLINRSAGQHCGSYPKAFAARHKKPFQKLGGFVVFSDYHIEKYNTLWNDRWPKGQEVPPRDNKMWYPYP